MDKSTLGSRLKALRALYGFSQAEVADFLGIDRSAYCCYEINRAKPDICNLVRMAKIYRVSTDYLLLGGSEEEEQLHQCANRVENSERPATLFEEDLFTLSGQERAMIAQFRLLPDRDEIAQSIHEQCVEYMQGDGFGDPIGCRVR